MSQRTTGNVAELITLAAGKEQVIVSLKDPGENIFILLYSNYYQMRYTILVDGIPLAYGRFRYIQPSLIKVYQAGPDATAGQIGGPGIWLAQYDDTNDCFGIVINLALKWKVSFVIKAKNIDSSEHAVQASIIYDKLEELPSLDIPKLDIQTTAPKDPRM